MRRHRTPASPSMVSSRQWLHDGHDLVQFLLFVIPPIGAPYPVDPPSSRFKILLSVEIPLTSWIGWVIQFSVAFYAEEISSILLHGEIDAVSSDTDLSVDVQSSILQSVIDLFFELAVESYGTAWILIVMEWIGDSSIIVRQWRFSVVIRYLITTTHLILNTCEIPM